MKEVAQQTGVTLAEEDLPTRADLVTPEQLVGLQEALISANGLAAMVAVVGSPAVASAARQLASDQRSWLLALERNDPSAASDSLADARPGLREFERAAQAEAF